MTRSSSVSLPYIEPSTPLCIHERPARVSRPCLGAKQFASRDLSIIHRLATASHRNKTFFSKAGHLSLTSASWCSQDRKGRVVRLNVLDSETQRAYPRNSVISSQTLLVTLRRSYTASLRKLVPFFSIGQRRPTYLPHNSGVTLISSPVFWCATVPLKLPLTVPNNDADAGRFCTSR